MTKDIFRVGEYENGRKYVYKCKDEMMKNKRCNDTELVTGHMSDEPDKTMNFVLSQRLLNMYLN